MFKDLPRLGRRHSDVYGLNIESGSLLKQRLLPPNATSLSDSRVNLASKLDQSLEFLQEKMDVSDSKESIIKE